MSFDSWSKKDYGLRDFIQKFCVDRRGVGLPLLVKVTEGSCGMGDVIADFSYDDVYWIVSLNFQSRALMKTRDGTLLSIPLDYRIKFKKAVYHKEPDGHYLADPVAMELGELIEANAMSAEKLCVLANIGSNFLLDGKEEEARNLGILEFVDTYDEVYLSAYTWTDDGMLQPHQAVIPAYVPIRLAYADPGDIWSKEKLKSTIVDIEKQYNQFTSKVSKGNTEVMMYSGQMSDVEYAYIEPKNYLLPQVEIRNTSNTASDVRPPPLPPRLRTGESSGDRMVQDGLDIGRKQSTRDRRLSPPRHSTNSDSGFSQTDSSGGSEPIEKEVEPDPKDPKYVIADNREKGSELQPKPRSKTPVHPAPRPNVKLPNPRPVAENHKTLPRPISEGTSVLTAPTPKSSVRVFNKAMSAEEQVDYEIVDQQEYCTIDETKIQPRTPHKAFTLPPPSVHSPLPKIPYHKDAPPPRPKDAPPPRPKRQLIPPSPYPNQPRDSETAKTERPPELSAAEYANFMAIENMRVEDVVEVLEYKLELGQFKEKFISEKIDGKLLKHLNVETLTRDIGMTGLQACKVIAFIKEGYQANIRK